MVGGVLFWSKQSIRGGQQYVTRCELERLQIDCQYREGWSAARAPDWMKLWNYAMMLCYYLVPQRLLIRGLSPYSTSSPFPSQPRSWPSQLIFCVTLTNLSDVKQILLLLTWAQIRPGNKAKPLPMCCVHRFYVQTSIFCLFLELYSYTEYSDFELNKQAFQEHFEQYGRWS